MLVLFLAGITLPYWQSIILTILVLIFYTGINIYYRVFSTDLFFQLALTDFAFIVTTLLGMYSKKELQKQEKYIKKLEEEKAKTEVYRKLYRISAELAHEIRNPLASIHGAAQLLQEGYVSERLIGIIQREAKRLDDLLRDFIQFASPLNNNIEKVNISELINEIIETYRRWGIDIEYNAPDNIEIYIDKKGFYSAISNIIKNATEWADKKIRITVKQKRNQLIIEVEDDGVGIKDEDKERIFEPFFTKKLGGSGLGLSIAKRFVIENKGYILIEKSDLGGAKFIISLPIVKNRRKNKDGEGNATESTDS
jgi:signal transduction histidine kinase